MGLAALAFGAAVLASGALASAFLGAALAFALALAFGAGAGAGAVVLAAAASALGAAFAFAAFFGAAGVALLDAVFFTAMIFNPWSREIIAAVVRIAIGDGRFSRARRICW